MKIYAITDDEQIIPLKEVKIDGDGEILLFQVPHTYRESDLEDMQKYLCEKFGKQVVVIDNRYKLLGKI